MKPLACVELLACLGLFACLGLLANLGLLAYLGLLAMSTQVIRHRPTVCQPHAVSLTSNLLLQNYLMLAYLGLT